MNTTTVNITFKASKSDIIQRLLEAGHINAEEAMTLIMQDPQPQITYPVPPQQPLDPYMPPYEITCTGNTGEILYKN